MPRYIDAEKIKYTEYINGDVTVSKDLVEKIPTADVQEVKHGHWARLGWDEWCCTCCGFVTTTEGSWDKPTEKYCPNCGAKMDLESKKAMRGSN
jgi:rubrerythrin